MNSRDQSRTILLVEDSDEDYQALTRALKQCNILHPVRRFSSGEDALDFLFKRGSFTNEEPSPVPWLILLDLNLPGRDGYEVLEEIKSDSQLRIIPVVVFSSSGSEKDMKRCYELDANSYLVKPIDFGRFKETVGQCVNYWTGVNKLPGEQWVR